MFIGNPPLTGSNVFISSGSVIQPTVSFNSTDMKLTIGEGIYRTFPYSDDFSGSMAQFTVPETTFDVVDNAKYYVCVIFNNGSPLMYLETDVSLTNDSNILVVYTIFTEGTELDVLDWGTESIGLSNKINERLIDTDRFGVVPGGFVLSSSNSALTCSEGDFYLGSNRISLAECSSLTDDCELLVRNGSGGWIISNITVFPNTKFDNNSGTLADLTTGHYGVAWCWRSGGNPKELYVAMGQASYANLELAQGAKIPADLPEKVQLGAMLLGRVIFLKSATTALVESSFDTVFNASAPTQHNSLLGIQGGDAGEHYHVNLEKYNVVQNTSGVNTGDETQATIFTKIGYTPLESNGIVAGTKTKIQYDTDGLVVAGTDATTADINDSLNRRYVTDAEHTNYNKVVTTLTNGSKISVYEAGIDNHNVIVANVYQKLVIPLTVENKTADFTVDAINNRLIYTGTATKRYTFNSCSSILNSGTPNMTIHFSLFRNGVQLTNTESAAKLDSSTSILSINASTGFTLAQNQYIELFAYSDKTNTFSTAHLQMVIMEDLMYSFNGV